MAIAIVTANSRNTRPTMPPISSTGMNTAISEKVIDTMVKPISREPLSAASNGRMPPSIWRTMFSSMTMASSTTKPTESVSASSVMLLIEKSKAYIAAQVAISEIGTASAGMMVAVAERRNRKITRMTSANGDRQRFLHVGDRIADRDRAVEQRLHADRRRNLRAELRQPGLHRVDHLDRVGVGLPLDRQHDRAVVVEPARDLVVLDAVDDVGDLAQPDRRAVAPGRDDVLVVRRPAHRARSQQRDVAVGAGQRADRRVGVRLGQHGADIVERDVARRRRHRIDLDAHRELLRAVDQHLGDAGKLRNLLGQHGLAVFVDGRHRQRRRVQADEQDREVAGIDLAERTAASSFRPAAGAARPQARSARRAPRRRCRG